jgi:multisubunit Na+/H+ antiporter MnhE subunit
VTVKYVLPRDQIISKVTRMDGVFLRHICYNTQSKVAEITSFIKYIAKTIKPILASQIHGAVLCLRKKYYINPSEVTE